MLRKGGFDEQKRIIRKAACWLRLRFAFNALATEIRAFKVLSGKLPVFRTDAERVKFVSNLRSFKGMIGSKGALPRKQPCVVLTRTQSRSRAR